MQEITKENIIEETKLDTPYVLEVVNVNSEYFGEVFTFTHRANANKKVWYKAVVDYQIGKMLRLGVWFKSYELAAVAE